jgi:hypothetical protein
MLELQASKGARAVLRGGSDGNVTSLPDRQISKGRWTAMNEVPRRPSRKGRVVIIREKRSALWLATGIFAVCLGLVRLAWALRVGVEWDRLRSVAGFLSAGGDVVGWFTAGGIAVGINVYRTVWRPRLVLGNRHVQLRRGQKAVVGQIPYRNIVSVEHKDQREWCQSKLSYEEIRHFFLEVIVLEWRDSDTWWPSIADDPEIVLRSVGRGSSGVPDGGWPDAQTIVIRDVYEKPLSKVRRLIMDRARPHWENRRSKHGL